jgi:hypothetical protein
VKKFESAAPANPEFRRRFADAIAVNRIYNSYEMAKQVGSAVHSGRVAR